MEMVSPCHSIIKGSNDQRPAELTVPFFKMKGGFGSEGRHMPAFPHRLYEILSIDARINSQ